MIIMAYIVIDHMGIRYAQCPPTRYFSNLLSAVNPTRIRFAVAADTPHNSRTSAFIMYSCVFRCASILLHRNVALSTFSSLISSLVWMASMSDALMADSMNAMNEVDSPAAFEVLMAA